MRFVADKDELSDERIVAILIEDYSSVEQNIIEIEVLQASTWRRLVIKGTDCAADYFEEMRTKFVHDRIRRHDLQIFYVSTEL